MDSINVLEEVAFLVEAHFALVNGANERFFICVNAKVRIELA